jgi:hypothetical protein
MAGDARLGIRENWAMGEKINIFTSARDASFCEKNPDRNRRQKI